MSIARHPLILFGTKPGAATGFEAEYQSILNFAASQGYTLPSIGQQTSQNELVIALKSAGFWSRIDELYVFASNGDADFASINWKNPVLADVAIRINSPTFIANFGFKGDGVSSRLTVKKAGTSNYQAGNRTQGFIARTQSSEANRTLIHCGTDRVFIPVSTIRPYWYMPTVLISSNTNIANILAMRSENGTYNELTLGNTINQSGTQSNTPTWDAVTHLLCNNSASSFYSGDISVYFQSGYAGDIRTAINNAFNNYWLTL